MGSTTREYFEAKINGRTYARFEYRDHAQEWIEAHKAEAARKAATTGNPGHNYHYEIVSVQRRWL